MYGHPMSKTPVMQGMGESDVSKPAPHYREVNSNKESMAHRTHVEKLHTTNFRLYNR